MSSDTLDTSDLDRYLGKPLQDARSVEPVQANDIRRWVQAMHYPNRFHYDAEYAKQTRAGNLIAPSSFTIAVDDGHGAAPACIGNIPNSHLIFGGDEWWFTDQRIAPGDSIHNVRIPFDYTVKQTSFAGPTCFQRGDNNYYNQDGDKIAVQRSTGIRYRPDLAREMEALSDDKDPHWTDEQLEELEDRKFEFIKSMHDLGYDKRLWGDVSVGDQLPTRVIGLHSIASFATEWRAYAFTIWGTMHRRTDMDFAEMGFDPEMAGHEGDPEMEKINPELTDGAYCGPSRGHLFPRWAKHIGMPRGYGYGASMGAWILDYFEGWAGQWGQLIHTNAHYRGPAFTGDATIMTAEVIDKLIDEDGRHIVQLDCKMKNQNDTVLATAKAEIALPVV